MINKGKVTIRAVKNTNANRVQSIINNNVAQGSTIVRDEWTGYRGLTKNFNHKIVNHGTKKFVHNAFHTNSIKGFSAFLKRGILGIYNSASPKNLSKYCDEFSYRYNTRNASDGERFTGDLVDSDRRFTYQKLIQN